MSEKGDVRMTRCPECENPIEVSRTAKLGASIECPECGTTLEVISLRPLELDYALGDEDWDEDWEEEV